MDVVISLLFISTLAQHVVVVVPLETSLRAVAEPVVGGSRVFCGTEVRLRCSVPDPKSKWEYLWFKASEKLGQTGENLVLWKASVRDNGKYYCQGVRDSVVGNIYTLKSLPVEIHVDGGWAILQVQAQPGLVGEYLNFTCHVRDSPPDVERILYKDDVGILTQRGLNPHFLLYNLTLDDQGVYSCRASWDIDRRTHSVRSVKALVQVLEVVTEPVLEIVEKGPQKINLTCNLQYNAHAPAPPLNYYFYKNNQRLGMATSVNHGLFRRSPGNYSCKAKVPQLQITRWSEPISFGQVTEP